MNLQKQPFPVDFVGNKPAFVVRAPHYASKGRAYSRTYALSALEVGTLFLITPYFSLSWSVRAQASNQSDSLMATSNADDLYNQIFDRVLFNHTINEHYELELTQGDAYCFLTFTDKIRAAQSVEIKLYQITTEDTDSDQAPVIVSTVAGVDPVLNPHFTVWAQFRVFKGDTETRTPEMNFNPSDDKVSVSTAILKAYFTKKDTPTYNELFAPYGCAEMERRVQLLYANRTSDGVGWVKRSDEITLLNGRLDNYAHSNNLPDWVTAISDNLYRAEKVGIFGQDDDLTVRTYADTEQYLYLYCGPAANREEILTLSVEVNRAGVVTQSSQSFLPSDNMVTRLPVSLAALDIENPNTVNAYTVQVLNADGVRLSRSFEVVPKPFNARTLLLLNRMNLYESFTINSLSLEHTTEGDDVRLNSIDQYLISNTQTTFIARTGMKTNREMSILENALGASDNILTDGQYGYYISIEPETYTIVDEKEDLLEVEIEFVVTGKFNRAPNTVTEIPDPLTYSETLIDNTQQ